MLATMAVTTLSALGSLLVLQSARDAQGASFRYDNASQACSNPTLQAIWSELPACVPRDAVVKLPLPDAGGAAGVVEVIPSHVVVERCGGVCHLEGNLYHKCVPAQEARTERRFDVMLRKSDGQMQCSSVAVEVHEQCKCGCDVDAANCSDKQTYDHHFCRCRCRDSAGRQQCRRERRRKFWNESLCQCMCRQEEYRECSTGFVYDPVDTCECYDPVPTATATSMAGAALIPAFLVLFLGFGLTVALLIQKIQRLKKKVREKSEEKRPLGASDTKLICSEPLETGEK